MKRFIIFMLLVSLIFVVYIRGAKVEEERTDTHEENLISEEDEDQMTEEDREKTEENAQITEEEHKNKEETTKVEEGTKEEQKPEKKVSSEEEEGEKELGVIEVKEEKPEVGLCFFQNISRNEFQEMIEQVDYFKEHFTELGKEEQITSFLEKLALLSGWKTRIKDEWVRGDEQAQELMSSYYDYELREFSVLENQQEGEKLLLMRLNDAPFRWLEREGILWPQIKYVEFEVILEDAPDQLRNYIQLMIAMYDQVIFNDALLVVPVQKLADIIILIEGEEENIIIPESIRASLQNDYLSFSRVYLFGGENTEIWNQEAFNEGYYQIDQSWIDSFRRIMQEQPDSLLASNVQIAYEYLSIRNFNLGKVEDGGFEKYVSAVTKMIMQKLLSGG
ncbi:MAG: hypothetical protein COA82_06855 [Alkaliphilus sp.]|nr:hypothetical protein [bacterium AH-315-L21]PHS34802.1 MAG: hypothetical protein COA82_06855 [Alkaliphilus sp.]